MIDVKIELRQQGGMWELVACSVELHDQHVPVLDIPPRLDETFATKEAAVATVKERVTIELQHNNRHESPAMTSNGKSQSILRSPPSHNYPRLAARHRTCASLLSHSHFKPYMKDTRVGAFVSGHWKDQLIPGPPKNSIHVIQRGACATFRICRLHVDCVCHCLIEIQLRGKLILAPRR